MATNIWLSHIIRTNRATNSPRLVFAAPWMADMGFQDKALVQFLPENGGLSFVLCNENIRKYSDLFHATKQMGGSLVQVYRHRDGLHLHISGSVLNGTGLEYGDTLLAKYEYGFIKLRKLPESTTIATVPHITGVWLGQIGFLAGDVFTIDALPGLITCTLHQNGVQRTTELVKHARQHKLTLMQVQSFRYLKRVSREPGQYQWFDIPQNCMQKAGFTPGETLIASYKHGIIKLQKPDFTALGF